MALMRGFSTIDAQGRLRIPGDIRRAADLDHGTIQIKVLRVGQTVRKPHLVIHRPDHPPYISMLEVVMASGVGQMDGDGKLLLPQALLEEAKLELGTLIEVKIHGARGQRWAVLHNRGKARPTTLQVRLGTARRKQERPWQTQVWDY